MTQGRKYPTFQQTNGQPRVAINPAHVVSFSATGKNTTHVWLNATNLLRYSVGVELQATFDEVKTALETETE